jgi:cobalamin biosynthesis Mg chelatase CobN
LLALLALVAFPVFAQAGGIPEYEVEPTGLPGGGQSVKPKPVGGQHHGSPTNERAEGSAAHSEPGSESEAEKSETGKSKTTGGGSPNGGNGPGGEGKPSGESGGKSTGHGESGKSSAHSQSTSQDKVGEGEKVAVTNGQPTAVKSSGGGSSPVVPILIAVIVLAAISIGVVLYRQRKGGSGSDHSVSSPNAS